MDLTSSGDVVAEPRATRRGRINAALAGIVVFVWMVFGASPAFADEFRVGILLDPTDDESTDTTFMDGFQLAVDQSPDVSHPPDVEGGDHLGSMDVVLVVVDGAEGPDEFLTAALDLIELEGVAIIIADVSSDVLATLFGPITESETMLIAMSGTDGAEFPATAFFYAAVEQNGLEALLTAQTPIFEDAFVAAYRRSPSASATRGYLAGRLVDISVESTDRDPSDAQALAEGLAAATRSTAPITQAEGPVESQSSSGFGSGIVVAIVVVLAAIGGLGLRSSRRRRSTTNN